MSAPHDHFIAGVFDSFSHCMESYFGKNDCLSDRINESLMKSIITNVRLAIQNPKDVSARSELMLASSLAIGGIVKSGKIADFQCHSIEHQLCAYTNCTHVTTFSELGINLNHETIDAISKSVTISQGCAKQLQPHEITSLLKACQ